MALRSRARLAAAALAVALAAAPAFAEGLQPRPAKKSERAAIGLPIYTSDGKVIGKVIATGVDEDNQAVLIGEIERPIGIGPQAVAIPTDLFVRKRDRIELTLTEAEVNARLGIRR
jgi:sporulation protein YlmC with PRC-barrel domain